MKSEIEIIHDWIHETGYPEMEAAARSALLKYPNLYDKNPDGTLSQTALDAHHAFLALDERIVLLGTMRRRFESFEG